MDLNTETKENEKYKLNFYCPDCNKRHSNFGVLPYKEIHQGRTPFTRIVCAECRSNNFIDSIILSKSTLIDFFFPKRIDPKEIIMGYGRYKNKSIIEIPEDYLEFILREQAKPNKERQYEVGFDMHNRNSIELYLGKWWHPIENKWVAL